MKIRSIKLQVLVTTLFCLSVAKMLPGQVYYSTLVGSVRDPSGAAVPGTRVVATDVNSGVQSSELTNTEGDYRISNLRPGQYRVTVTKAGFKEETVSGITLLVAVTSRVDISLALGRTDQQVTVTGTASMVQTDTAERGGVLTGSEVEALPIPDRLATSLTYLMPGESKSQNYFGIVSPSGNGLGAFQTNFLVDGGALTNFYMMLPAERVTVDDVQEFKVETANVTADRGLLAGSTVSIATKAGTNQLHGVGYEFVQNNDFNARNFFSPTVPIEHYNEFGGNIGGPIKRNKLFFFGSYEGVRQPSSVTFLSTVPTAAERVGNFAPGTGEKSTPTIYNPNQLDAAGNRLPFANNQIPSTMFNSIALKYLALYPTPNYGTAANPFPNYLVNARSTNTYDRVSGRVDYTISSKDTLLGRWTWQRNPGIVPGPIPGATDNSQNFLPGSTLNVTWTHMLSPQTFNEARFSYAYMNQFQSSSDFVGQNVAQQWGFENGPRLEPGIYGLPGIGFGVGGPHALGGGQIWQFPDFTRRWEDNLTFLRGNHTFKTGVLYQQYGINTIYSITGGSSQSFSGHYTAAANYNTQVGDFSGGQPFADFLLGAEGGVAVNENPQISPDRRHVWNMFFMDDWKARSNLVLQLGLRYDLNLPATMANGWAAGWLDGLGSRTGQSVVFPANAKAALPKVLGAGIGLGFPYTFSNNDWVSAPDWKNLGPRIGVAWRPFHDTKTVIRGGFGVYYGYTLSTIENNRNWGRPFESFGSTPPPPLAWSAPPYTLGDAPFITPAFQPGTPFRSGYVASPDWPDSRILSWNVTFQRQFGNNWVWDVAYVANRSTNDMNVQFWNSPHPPGYTFKYADGSTYTVPMDPTTPIQQTKKYPELDSGTSSWPVGHTQYNSLQTSVAKTLSRGIQFRAGYTRSDLMTGGYDYQDEWANLSAQNYYSGGTGNGANSDMPNVFYATYVISLPGQNLKGLAGLAAGGWKWSGIVSVASGPREYISEAFPQWRAYGGSLVPNLTGEPNLPASQRTLQHWFNTAAFSQPGVNQYGNSPFCPIRDDGTKNVDMAIEKSFRITEHQHLEVRAEAFNIFNHPTFGSPDTTRGDATFGIVSSQANSPRLMQFGIKYQF